MTAPGVATSFIPMAYVLHQLLSESAKRNPAAEAVRLLNSALTYGELERLSNQVAHRLIASGVRRGDRVGLYLQKSPFAIASIFGIMKTGACYVPVDANAPGLRLEEIARQCAFRALITSAPLYAKLPKSFHQTCVLCALLFVDDLPPSATPVPAFTFAKDLPNEAEEDPEVPVIDHDLAYILFTSGSTGVPKGVMLSHLNALTFVNWVAKRSMSRRRIDFPSMRRSISTFRSSIFLLPPKLARPSLSCRRD